ncbi:hypothetical protein ABBQ32_006057 [Trebouxia sp. C0010 RCD-2024]
MDAADAGSKHARAIISPYVTQCNCLTAQSCTFAANMECFPCSHAGLRYCGHVMACAYKHIQPQQVSRVFVVGPSHHVYTKQCLLSPAASYSTPQGEIEVDQEVYEQLLQTGHFVHMQLDVDEAEHSLELQMPFIMHTMREQSFKLVPIMVGAIDPTREAMYGRLLGPFLDDPTNLFVISSDFCHWGQRFGFTYYDTQKHGSISRSIQWLDNVAMDIIEQADPEGFTAYLDKYGNTICGRHPIGILLNMFQHSRLQHTISFKKYDQSSKCQSVRESSVSYAAAIVTIA